MKKENKGNQEVIDGLQAKITELEEKNESLRKSLDTTTSLLRLTVGLAYNAHPDLEILKSTINMLYKA